MSYRGLFLLIAICAVGCGDDSAAASAGDDGGGSPPPVPAGKDGGAPGPSERDGAVDTAEMRDAATNVDAGDQPDHERDASVEHDAATDVPEPLVELPAGSSEVDGIVNLVDEAAAAQVEQYILDEGPEVIPTQRHRLTLPANLFLTSYPEDYDFLFFITDHELVGGTTVARFEAVNRPAVPGGTSEFEIRAAGYRSNGRLKGVIGVRYRPLIFPPVAHELLHYWANDLDPRFGFGADGYGEHWGLTSVNGILGGYDRTTLRCQTPAGALPPGCTALGSGRTRYVVGAFHGNDNTARDIPYAPLELYLMGLIPSTEVPSSFQRLAGGAIDETTYDDATNTVVVEADSIAETTFASIMERHGEVPQLAPDARQFKVAFVVVSAEPAPAKVLSEVAFWAAIFDGRQDKPEWPSFEELALGHATIDAELGERRKVSDPPPAEREPLACDVLAQDCPRPELSCNEYAPPLCALSGGIAVDQPCNATFACAPGLECMRSASDQSKFFCKPYCDPTGSGARSCQTLCPGKSVEFQNSDGVTVSAACTPD